MILDILFVLLLPKDWLTENKISFLYYSTSVYKLSGIIYSMGDLRQYLSGQFVIKGLHIL